MIRFKISDFIYTPLLCHSLESSCLKEIWWEQYCCVDIKAKLSTRSSMQISHQWVPCTFHLLNFQLPIRRSWHVLSFLSDIINSHVLQGKVFVLPSLPSIYQQSARYRSNNADSHTTLHSSLASCIHTSSTCNIDTTNQICNDSISRKLKSILLQGQHNLVFQQQKDVLFISKKHHCISHPLNMSSTHQEPLQSLKVFGLISHLSRQKHVLNINRTKSQFTSPSLQEPEHTLALNNY